MSGNVVVFCQVTYGRYPRGTVSSRTGYTNSLFRIVRGGSWHNTAQRFKITIRENTLQTQVLII
ncbi:hypothetical protein [Dyadobacter psychrotolerans]|uniref:Uncharacterized protein n=1 Tax=Dyadobacter psychrotolerans TaxID=2541721 RepID=A0A4R5DCM2_9BACT|nr:hypothetical protein [Dyadobacter psychrotolerans]TDE10737.1 hypothetical protein E0F88_27060 [Dyadobacter psychrotolerans]